MPSSRRAVFPQLEVQNAHQKGQADGIGYDDDGIGSHKSVDRPKGHPGRERQEHFQGEVAGGAGVPAFFQLRIVRHRRAKCRR